MPVRLRRDEYLDVRPGPQPLDLLLHRLALFLCSQISSHLIAHLLKGHNLLLMGALGKQLYAEDAACRFWAAWSAVLLGKRAEALELLEATVVSGLPFRERALQMALRAMDTAASRNWLKGLAQYPDWRRDLVVGAGIAADPAYVPWLIKQMETPELARVGGEAFTLITGADLAMEDLEGDRPEGFESGPTESAEDEDVAMDPDEDLPWHAPDLVQRWWEASRQRFQVGTRYLVGERITTDHCRKVLVSGLQRQRIAAAWNSLCCSPARRSSRPRLRAFAGSRCCGSERKQHQRTPCTCCPIGSR